jgi:hypothetical protein
MCSGADAGVPAGPIQDTNSRMPEIRGKVIAAVRQDFSTGEIHNDVF